MGRCASSPLLYTFTSGNRGMDLKTTAGSIEAGVLAGNNGQMVPIKCHHLLALKHVRDTADLTHFS